MEHPRDQDYEDVPFYAPIDEKGEFYICTHYKSVKFMGQNQDINEESAL